MVTNGDVAAKRPPRRTCYWITLDNYCPHTTRRDQRSSGVSSVCLFLLANISLPGQCVASMGGTCLLTKILYGLILSNFQRVPEIIKEYIFDILVTRLVLMLHGMFFLSAKFLCVFWYLRADRIWNGKGRICWIKEYDWCMIGLWGNEWHSLHQSGPTTFPVVVEQSTDKA